MWLTATQRHGTHVEPCIVLVVAFDWLTCFCLVLCLHFTGGPLYKWTRLPWWLIFLTSTMFCPWVESLSFGATTVAEFDPAVAATKFNCWYHGDRTNFGRQKLGPRCTRSMKLFHTHPTTFKRGRKWSGQQRHWLNWRVKRRVPVWELCFMNGKNIGTTTLSLVWKCGAGFEQTIVVECRCIRL